MLPTYVILKSFLCNFNVGYVVLLHFEIRCIVFLEKRQNFQYRVSTLRNQLMGSTRLIDQYKKRK